MLVERIENLGAFLSLSLQNKKQIEYYGSLHSGYISASYNEEKHNIVFQPIMNNPVRK
jgi:hypothetical protein